MHICTRTHTDSLPHQPSLSLSNVTLVDNHLCRKMIVIVNTLFAVFGQVGERSPPPVYPVHAVEPGLESQLVVG